MCAQSTPQNRDAVGLVLRPVELIINGDEIEI